MEIFLYCLAAVLTVLSVLNFIIEHTTRGGKIINLINAFVALASACAVLALVQNKVLAFTIVLYMISRFIRRMRFESDLLNDKAEK